MLDNAKLDLLLDVCLPFVVKCGSERHLLIPKNDHRITIVELDSGLLSLHCSSFGYYLKAS
jgi:hypothetical protein